MTKKYKLTDEFDNDDTDHFTHYDYLLQVIHTGQPTAYREHLKEMNDNALVNLVALIKHENSIYQDILKDEITKRMRE